MLNDQDKKNIIGIELVNRRSHGLFVHMQRALKIQGFELFAAEKFLNQECRQCKASHHMSMLYRKAGNVDNEREFIICLECWTTHEILFIYED